MTNISVTTKIFQELSRNSDSVIPIAVKDTLSNCAITYIYDKKASKEDGKERAIEEFGTEVLWIGGIPLLKKLFNSTVYKFFKADPNFDIRNLEKGASGNLDRLEFLANNAKDAVQKQKLTDILKNENLQKLYKNLHFARFVVATAATLAALSGLIIYKQKTTEKELEEKYKNKIRLEQAINSDIKDKKVFNAFAGSKKDVSFGNNITKFLSGFMFNPVNNMKILDAGIATTRLAQGRKGERFEIGFKELFQIIFIYKLAAPIGKGLEKLSESLFKKPISTEFLLLNNKKLPELIQAPELKDAIKTLASKEGDEVLKYIYNNDNALTQMLKISEIIPTIKGSNGVIDSFAHIEPNDIKKGAKDILKLLEASANKTDKSKFLKQVRNFKAGAIIANVLIGAAAIGILQPTLNILLREKRNKGEKSNPAFKNIEQEMAQKFNFQG